MMAQNPAVVYTELLEKTREAIRRGRDPRILSSTDVARARMCCYAFRTHTIGLFHTLRRALEEVSIEAPDPGLQRCIDTVILLQQLATWPVPRDFRAALGPFWMYDQLTRRLLEDMATLAAEDERFRRLRSSLQNLFQEIQESGGLWVGRGDRVDPDRLFRVPGIAVEIQPIAYLEHISWNVARLGPESVGRTVHKHACGVEIHLGFSPLHGYTILDGCAAEVREGYAMPIPAHVPHGFDTLRQEEHLLPFIFGSATYAGWGIFFDVEPVPTDTSRLKKVPLDSHEMNGSIYVERELQRLLDSRQVGRTVLCPAERTRSQGAGALELAAIVANGDQGSTPATDTLLYLWHGSAILELAGITRPLQSGDHVGLPRGIPYELHVDSEPAVFLESRLYPDE